MHSSLRRSGSSYQEMQGGGWVRPLVLLFYAGQCTASQKLEQIMTQLAPAYSGHLDFAMVDAPKDGDLARGYRIHSIPSLVIVYQECVVYVAIGVLPQREMEAALDAAVRRSRVAIPASATHLES